MRHQSTYVITKEYSGAQLPWGWSSAGCASVMIMLLGGGFDRRFPARTCLVVEVTQTFESLLDLGLAPLLPCSFFMVWVAHGGDNLGVGIWVVRGASRPSWTWRVETNESGLVLFYHTKEQEGFGKSEDSND